MADLDRARRVAAILNDPDVVAALDEIERGTVAAWQGASTPADREIAWHDNRAVKRLRDRLKTIATELKFHQSA